MISIDIQLPYRVTNHKTIFLRQKETMTERARQHPGILLLAELEKQHMKQSELAIRTGVSEKHVSTVVKGTKPLSPSFARKLDVALGAESGTWAKYQAAYDDYEEMQKERNNVGEEEIDVLHQLKDVVDYFLESGDMHNHCGDVERVLQLRTVLRIANLTSIPKIRYNAAYRAQTSGNVQVNLYVLFAWQRMCELRTEKVDVRVPFDRQKLLDAIPELRRILNAKLPAKNVVESLKSVFLKCGIAFDFVPHFRGAPVQGFIKQTDENKIVLCVTNRGKKADRFWFSLFHEIGHLINGDLNVRFVDFESVKSDVEGKADAFARDALIPADRYYEFCSTRNYNSLDEVKRFSREIGVPPWIIIGRLKHDEKIECKKWQNTPSYEL